MLIADQIKERLKSVPDGVVLTLKDFNVAPQYEGYNSCNATFQGGR